MGGDRDAQQSGTQTQKTQPEPTPEQTEYNKLRLGQLKETEPFETKAIKSGVTLSDLLLTGQGLPGYLSKLPGGISPEVTQEIVDRSLGDVRAGLQGGGLLDSGVRSELEARTSSDIRTQSEQFNLGNLQQLINLAVGGQAFPLDASQGFGSQLSQSLTGLQGSTMTGSSAGQSNPFRPSFGSTFSQGFAGSLGSGLGNTIGSPSFSVGPVGFNN